MYINPRRRRPWRRVSPLAAMLGLGATIVLVVGVLIAFIAVRTFAGDWLDLKLESARYRLLEALPQPERPDFVPTPLTSDTAQGAPTILWTAKATLPATPSAGTTNASAALPRPTASARAAVVALPTRAATRTPLPATPTQPAPKLAAASDGLNPIQPAVQLTGVVTEAQRFNNCGPTTLRMYLSYYGYTKDTQVQIANVLKPNKDDKNVSPSELIGYAESRGFRMIARVNGNLDLVKQTLSNNLPIMIEEGYNPPEANKGWMGHYLLLTGYDAEGITAQDSYAGPNRRIRWQDMDTTWRQFNRTYLLLYRDAQAPIVNALVGGDLDDAMMYTGAAQRAQDEMNANPQDPFAAFNLGSSLVGLGEYNAAAEAFDRARVLKLPWRMLWYQFGPYEAYYRVGRYDEVVSLADATQKNVGDLEESYYYKALALVKLGRTAEARDALAKAVQYNPGYLAAQQALQQLGS